MKSKRHISRRKFLKTGVLGSVALGTGCFGGRYSWRSDTTRAGKLRLLFFTDVHAKFERAAPEAMERAAEAINRQKSDIIIAGGDLTEGGFQTSAEAMAPRWDLYMKMHNSIRGDILPVIGNHDLVGARPENGQPPARDPREVFRNRFGLERTYYSYDAQGYHIIILDALHITGDERKYEGRVSPEHLDWIQEDLSKVSPYQPTILVSHMPLLTAAFQAMRGATYATPANRAVVNNREVLKLLKGRNLILVLQGHLHVDELIRWRRARFITGGAICGNWWKGVHRGTQEGFGIATLKDGQIDWSYTGYGWEAVA